MKAIELLKNLGANITKGRNIIETAKKYHYSLDVLQGEIKPRKTYYATFKDSDVTACAPDVIFILGGGDTQYLYELD